MLAFSNALVASILARVPNPSLWSQEIWESLPDKSYQWSGQYFGQAFSPLHFFCILQGTCSHHPRLQLEQRWTALSVDLQDHLHAPIYRPQRCRAKAFLAGFGSPAAAELCRLAARMWSEKGQQKWEVQISSLPPLAAMTEGDKCLRWWKFKIRGEERSRLPASLIRENA